MKITKYEKKKNGMYQVFFDNGNNVDLHEEIILKYDLLIKKEASNALVDKMLDENKIYIAYNLAIKYISGKMRSKKEIREYLIKKNIDNDSIEKVLDILVKEKYLNDFSYANAFVNDKILLSSDGPNKICSKLSELGISDEAISDAIGKFSSEIQIERINKIANKYISTNRSKSINSLKNKIVEHLYSLGYDKSLIIECVNHLSFNDDIEIAKKEYEKIYKKLSRKYSGSELELRVKQKMYALGFYKY